MKVLSLTCMVYCVLLTHPEDDESMMLWATRQYRNIYFWLHPHIWLIDIWSPELYHGHWSSVVYNLFVLYLTSGHRSEEDVGDDIIHRRQRYSEYYGWGHEKEEKPRWCHQNLSEEFTDFQLEVLRATEGKRQSAQIKHYTDTYLNIWRSQHLNSSSQSEREEERTNHTAKRSKVKNQRTERSFCLHQCSSSSSSSVSSTLFLSMKCHSIIPLLSAQTHTHTHTHTVFQ